MREWRERNTEAQELSRRRTREYNLVKLATDMHIRHLYLIEYNALLAKHREEQRAVVEKEFPELERRDVSVRAYNRAAHRATVDLREAHRAEYDYMMAVLKDQLQSGVDIVGKAPVRPRPPARGKKTNVIRGQRMRIESGLQDLIEGNISESAFLRIIEKVVAEAQEYRRPYTERQVTKSIKKQQQDLSPDMETRIRTALGEK